MPLGMQDTGSLAITALRGAVRQLPSIIARLVFLAGLRDPNSGVYRTRTASRAEHGEVDRLLRSMHEQAFSRWLNYRLEEQKADLDLYFSSLDCGKAVAVRTWRQLESYRWLVPASAKPPERQLFFADLEALLELMANELGLPTASAGEREGPASGERLLTTQQVSRWLMVPTRTLRFWAEMGEIAAIKAGRQWRFPKEAIRQWLRRRGASA